MDGIAEYILDIHGEVCNISSSWYEPHFCLFPRRQWEGDDSRGHTRSGAGPPTGNLLHRHQGEREVKPGCNCVIRLRPYNIFKINILPSATTKDVYQDITPDNSSIAGWIHEVVIQYLWVHNCFSITHFQSSLHSLHCFSRSVSFLKMWHNCVTYISTMGDLWPLRASGVQSLTLLQASAMLFLRVSVPNCAPIWTVRLLNIINVSMFLW